MRKKKSHERVTPNNAFAVKAADGETLAQAMARELVDPAIRNSMATSGFIDKTLGHIDRPGAADFSDSISATAHKAASGDLRMASRMLAAQAVTLDSMFTELARRAAYQLGRHSNAAETYGRLALKAQSNCRATLEALAKLHQPREQTVRHVHVNEGGQAVIADEFHNHSPGFKNGKSDGQVHEQGACRTALLGSDSSRDGVPVAGA